MFINTINFILLINVVVSSRINFIFPKSECSLGQSQSQAVIDGVKLRLKNLDKEYRLVLRSEIFEFDYSGGLKNIQFLNDCIKAINKNDTIVCPMIKDLHLLNLLSQRKNDSTDTFYITDEIVNIRFGLSLATEPDSHNFNFVFKVFHSSIWSILLLISLLMGLLLYILEVIGQLESSDHKYTMISITEAYFITYLTLWGSTVCKKLRTYAAKIALHIWQVFVLLVIILYSAAVVCQVLSANRYFSNNAMLSQDIMSQATTLICSKETENLCKRIKIEYPQQKFDWFKCRNNSINIEQGSVFVVFGPNNLRNSWNLLYNNSIIFVSNNISIVREINTKLLSIAMTLFEDHKPSDISDGLIGLTIRLRHIYGLILFLVFGCGSVSLIQAIAVFSRIISRKTQECHKKKLTNRKDYLLNDERKINGAVIEPERPNSKIGKKQETEV